MHYISWMICLDAYRYSSSMFANINQESSVRSGHGSFHCYRPFTKIHCRRTMLPTGRLITFHSAAESKINDGQRKIKLAAGYTHTVCMVAKSNQSNTVLGLWCYILIAITVELNWLFHIDDMLLMLRRVHRLFAAACYRLMNTFYGHLILFIWLLATPLLRQTYYRRMEVSRHTADNYTVQAQPVKRHATCNEVYWQRVKRCTRKVPSPINRPKRVFVYLKNVLKMLLPFE